MTRHSPVRMPLAAVPLVAPVRRGRAVGRAVLQGRTDQLPGRERAGRHQRPDGAADLAPHGQAHSRQSDIRGAEPATRRPGAGEPHLCQHAEKDGATIAIIERGTPQLAIQGDPNAQFDPLKMTWLGSVSSYANDAYVLWVNSSFAAKTVADLRPTAQAVARIGTTGAGATNLVFTQISKDVLGLNIQNVRGYRGAADVFLAQQRGEVDGQVVGHSAIKVGQKSLYEAGAFRGADPVRAHHALARSARRADRPRIDQRPEGAGAAQFRRDAVLHGAAAGGAARHSGGPRQGAADRASWR